MSVQLPPVLPASRGNIANIGITAISWNSKTAKPDCPASLPPSSRSSMTLKAIAVEDKAKPMPITRLVCHVKPNIQAMAVMIRVVISTCAPPSPRIGARICHSFLGLSSKPIRKSSSTTPNSEKCRIASTSLIKPSPHGPIATPANR